MATQRQWGLTAPISTNFPTETELQLNETLLAELKDQKTFESAEETERRKTVLQTMQQVTIKFVKHVGQLKGLPPNVIDNAGGKIFTFGSYRLGVFGPGSDIDTLIVTPKHCAREDFFEHFPKLLEEASAPGAIEELTPVPDAHVPIMKLEYAGISIDLIFASLQQSTVPLNLTLDDNTLLRGLDETDLRSVNGTRVTDEILNLVPQQKTFRHALRAIKLWAQRRAVYANVMGFPGGVAWAMMVARICQLYPNATGSVVIGRFFGIMKSWRWPTPVMLKAIEDGPLQVRVWNPKIYPGDSRHLMPIITPAYPAMCATHNVTKSTLTIITRELHRADAICNKIVTTGEGQWKELFQRHTFFSQGYKYYLSIVSASLTKDAQLIWSGLVQSKVRRLVSGIEQSQPNVQIAHPYTKGFDRVHKVKNEDEKDEVLQGSIKYQITEVKTTEEANDIKQQTAAQGDTEGLTMPTTNGEKQDDKDGPSTVHTTTFYVGIELKPDAKSLDISWPVAEFKRQCTEWPQYNEDLNSIRIIHVKSYDLPEDVFEPGEKRPIKAKKAKAANKMAGQALAKKRSHTEAKLDENEMLNGVKRRQSENLAAQAPPIPGMAT